MALGWLTRRAAAPAATREVAGLAVFVSDPAHGDPLTLRALFGPESGTGPVAAFRGGVAADLARYNPITPAAAEVARLYDRDWCVGADPVALPAAVTGSPRLYLADVQVPAGDWVPRLLAGGLDDKLFRLRVGPGPRVLAATHLSRAEAVRRRLTDVGRTGVPVLARLLQANHTLYGPGDNDAAAMVLVSFDPRVSAARLAELAQAVYALKEHAPDHPAAAGPVASERGWQYHRRFRLPADLTGGPAVYACDLWVPRAFLPGGAIGDRRLRCVADPGDAGGIELLPPG